VYLFNTPFIFEVKLKIKNYEKIYRK